METIADVKQKYQGYSSEQLMEVIVSQQSTIHNLKTFLFQKKSERRYQDPVGINPMFDEVEGPPQDQTEDEPEKPRNQAQPQNKDSKKSRGKRSPISDDVPRVRVEHDLPESEKICPVHGTPMTKIGETISEQINVIPARIEVIENVSMTYKCPCCAEDGEKDHIVTSKMEPQPIPKSMASPTLLAYIATRKYQDALPLNRQQKIFERYGIELDRTTMARWMIQCADLATPLMNLMNEGLLAAKVIGCDETVVQVLNEPHRKPEQQSYMWVTTRFEGHPIVVFNYQTGRSAKVAEELLSDYQGVVVCDGLKSYDAFANRTGVTLAGCLAHLRRKFHAAEKAAKKADPKGIPKAKLPLDLIRDIYKIEKRLTGKSPPEIESVRKDESAPIMASLRAWLDEFEGKILPKSLLGKAIHYALDQWPKLEVFLTNPLVPVDNNRTERAIRPFVIGRGNWVFSASQNGAYASAALYSLIETAKANNLEPFSYLSLIFKELPKVSDAEGYEKLLPYNTSQHFNLKPYQSIDKNSQKG